MTRDTVLSAEAELECLEPMSRFTPYPEYRDSGVEWLGFLPTHWQLDRIKWTVSSCRNGIWGTEPDGSNDIVCIRVADFDRARFRIVLQEPTLRAVTPSERKRRLLRKGDLLLEKSGGGELQPVGAVMYFDHDMEAVCSNFVARMPVEDAFDGRFLAYLHAHLYSGRVNTRSIKQTTGIQNLDSASYLNEHVPFVPLPEQRAIAAFLDRETARIDELIAKKQQLIELLQEKRTALISHIVTKGLNPDAPMKGSGIDWLGQVPKHWERKRIKHVLHRIVDTEHKTAPFYPDGDFLVVRTTNVRNGRLVMAGAKFTDAEGYAAWTRRAVPRPGDILFTREAPAGEACVVPDDRPVCLGQRMVLFQIRRQQLDGHFFLYSIYSGIADEFIKLLSQGSTVSHFNISDIGNIPLLVPPIAEQKQIAADIHEQAERFDGLNNTVADAIDRLREYRSALISAAVTGKIDVRKVKFQRSGLAKRLINAGEYLFAKHDAESALTPICNAIDRVAKDIYGQSGRSTYQKFIHERMELITRVAFNGTAILNLNFAVSPVRDGQGGIVTPKTTLNGVHFYSFEQIMYHVVRCRLDHECEIDPVLQDGGRGSGEVKMSDDGTLRLSFDAVAHGLLFAVLSEVDLWSELVGTIYEHVEWKGTPLIDLIGQKKRMHAMSKTPAPETAK